MWISFEIREGTEFKALYSAIAANEYTSNLVDKVIVDMRLLLHHCNPVLHDDNVLRH